MAILHKSAMTGVGFGAHAYLGLGGGTVQARCLQGAHRALAAKRSNAEPLTFAAGGAARCRSACPGGTAQAGRVYRSPPWELCRRLLRPEFRGRDDGLVKLTLDLHRIYNRGEDIDRALRAVMEEAVAKKAPLVEIIPGKGSGGLKKRVLRFLDQKEVRALYHRVEKDSDNFGRIFVHFRWKSGHGHR